MVISALRAVCALRMRVRRSAIGSVMLMRRSSPARLRDARNLSAVHDLADLHARQPELAVDATGAARDRAAHALAGRARISRQRLQLRLRGGARLRRGPRVADLLFERCAFGRVLLHRLRATLLALDHARLRHTDLIPLCFRTAYFRNGKLNASSKARPCLLSLAVVVMVMSMPRVWSAWSYWISGKRICSFTPML